MTMPKTEKKLRPERASRTLNCYDSDYDRAKAIMKKHPRKFPTQKDLVRALLDRYEMTEQWPVKQVIYRRNKRYTAIQRQQEFLQRQAESHPHTDEQINDALDDMLEDR